MTHKLRRTGSPKKPQGPQAAQLEAVRRLSQAGRDEEARARVTALRARYPDFKPLLALAWEVEDNAGFFSMATLHAWDWSQASPGSTAALQALADSAMSAGLVALAASAGKQLAQTEGVPMPEIPPVHGELGDISFEQGVKFDLSRLFLSHERYDAVVAVLEGIDHPSAHNNLALARFAKGDIETALANAEENWRRDTRNLFGLHELVRLRLWRHGRAAAAELADALIKGRPARAEDAYGQLAGLLLLGAYKAAIDAWRAMQAAPFWDDTDRLCGRCAYFAGIAALREGDTVLAQECISQALDIDPDDDNAAELDETLAMADFGGEADPASGEFRDWFPATWINHLAAASRPDAREDAFDAICRHCDAHPDYLAVAAELGGPVVRFPAVEILKQRASDGDLAALDTLRSLLTRPCGPDEERFDLDRWLENRGYLTQGQARPLLVRGKVQEHQLVAMRLTVEPKNIDLPPGVKPELERVHKLLARSDQKGALRILQELVDAHPDHPLLLGNLASIKEGLGHADDEVEALLQRAQAADPGYLFAQAGLARIAARKGDTERARELLKPLYGRDEYHVSEWKAILMTERTIASNEGDMAAVSKLDNALLEMLEQFG